MKIERETIYGNIGYIVEWNYARYLIRKFDWDRQCYLLESWRCPTITEWVPVKKLIGCTIIEDKWEKLKNGKI